MLLPFDLVVYLCVYMLILMICGGIVHISLLVYFDVYDVIWQLLLQKYPNLFVDYLFVSCDPKASTLLLLYT